MPSTSPLKILIDTRLATFQSIKVQPGQRFQLLIDGVAWTGQSQINDKAVKLLRRGRRLEVQLDAVAVAAVEDFYEGEAAKVAESNAKNLSSQEVLYLLQEGSAIQVASANVAAVPIAEWGTWVSQSTAATQDATAATGAAMDGFAAFLWTSQVLKLAVIEQKSDITTPAVTVVRPATGTASLSGTAQEGGTLSAVTSGITDPDGTSLNFSYQWQMADAADGSYANINGATSSSFDIASDQSQVGKFLRVVVTATNDGTANGTSFTSAPSLAVANVNDAATGSAALGGTAQEGGTLNAVTSGITDPDGTPLSFNYQWQMADTADGSYANIIGATSSSFNIASDQSQVGKFLRVVVTATNDGTANGTSFISSPSAAVANVNDPAIGTASLSGTAQEGGTLNAVTSGINDPDGTSLNFSYQWQMADTADGSYTNINGATSSSFNIASDQSQVGKYVRVVVTATNDGTANGTSFTSAPSQAVANVNDPATGTASLSGTAQEGGTLDAVTSGITDPDGTSLNFSYQWQVADTADGSYANIIGATSSSFNIASDQSQVGKFLRVVVTATNDGTANGTSFTSAPSLAVVNVNDSATGTASLSGTAQEGGTLTANTSGITDPDGTPLTFSYQWQMADTADGSYTNINGATSSSFNIASDQSQVGKFLRVVVTATNDGTANGTSFTSAPSQAVANVNDPATGTASLSGTAQEGGTLNAVTSGINDPDGTSLNFSYQWQVADTANGSYTNINGATSSSFNIASDQSQVGKYVRVVVTATNDGTANGTSFTSAPSQAVANVNDAPVPNVAMSAQTASLQSSFNYSIPANAFRDEDSDTLSYSAQLSTGAALSTIGLSMSSIGVISGTPTVAGNYNLVIWATDTSNTSATANLGLTVISAANNHATGTASLSGTAQEGGTLNAVTSGITDPDGTPLAFSYQWQMADTANGSYTNINGATSSSFNIASDQSQVGKFLRVVVTATNDGTANGTSFTSAPSLAVANVNDPATGTASLSGTAQEGGTLNANTSGITDPDGTVLSFNYQWQMADAADGSYANINGATSSSFNIASDQSQVGKFLRVVVTATNDGTANGTSFTSAPSLAVANVNDAATGSTTLSGTAQEGGTLNAVTSGITDPDGTSLNFSYQWQMADTADGSYANINGATSSSFNIASDQSQVGKFLRVVVTATNDGTANGTSFTSAPSLAVANVNDAATGSAALGGTAQEGGTLNAVTSGITDPDGTVLSFNYQWQVADSANGSYTNINGATSSSFNIASDQSQVGKFLRVVVTATNDGTANGTSFTSAPSLAVANVNDPATGTANLSGTAQEGGTLNAVTSGITDPDGSVLRFRYRWQESVNSIWQDLDSQTASQLQLPSDETLVGKTVRVRVTATDSQAERTEFISHGLMVQNVNDAAWGIAAIQGLAQEGGVLTAVTSGITDPDGTVLSFNYQWQVADSANGSYANINDATSSSYNIANDQSQVGKFLRVVVTATNDGTANGTSFTSAPSLAVVNVNDAATGTASLSGTAQEGGTLTANTSGITDPDGTPLTFGYQWQVADTATGHYTDIAYATGSSYVIASDQSQVGKFIRVMVNPINADGQRNSAFMVSSPSSAVANVNDPATGLVEIQGNAVTGARLQAVTSRVFDPDGTMLSFGYQWQIADTASGSYTNISGATASNYNVASDLSQVGKFFRVVVTASNDGTANGTSFTSAASAQIKNTNALATQLVKHIGIVSADGANGTFYFTTNGGSTWSELGTVSDEAVLLLEDNANTRLYFKPNANFVGTDSGDIVFRTWYRWAGVGPGGGVGTPGNKVTSTTPAGQESFSQVSESIRIGVGPVDVLPTGAVGSLLGTVNKGGATDFDGGVTINGFGHQNEAINAVVTNIADPDGTALTFVYRWQMAHTLEGPYVDIPNETGRIFTTASDQIEAGRFVRVVAIAVNDGSAGGTVFTSWPLEIGPYPGLPLYPRAAVIRGETVEGGTLTAYASNGSVFEAVDAPFRYQWQIADSAQAQFTDIVGATQRTYVIAADQSQLGKFFRVNVYPIDDLAGLYRASSPFTTAVRNINDPATGVVGISGNAQPGETLHAVVGGIADPDGTTLHLRYQWQIGESSAGPFTNLLGATDSSLVIASDPSPLGKYFRLLVLAENDGTANGTSFSAVSSQVVGVVPETGNSDGINEAPVSVPGYKVNFVLRAGVAVQGFFRKDFADPDRDDALTIQLHSGTLPIGLSLDGNGVLRGTPTQAGVFNFMLRAIDLDGLSHQHSYQIQILDAHAPAFHSPVRVTVSERTVTEVFRPVVSDNASGLRFELAGGDDDNLFVIDQSTGALRFLTAPDFERPQSLSGTPQYQVRIRAVDADGNATEQAFTIELGNVVDSRQDVFELWAMADAAQSGNLNANINAYNSHSAALMTLKDPVDRSGFANQADARKVLAQWIDSVTGTDVVSQQEYAAGFSITGKAAAGLHNSIRFRLDKDRTTGIDGEGAQVLSLGNNDLNADGLNDVTATYDTVTGEWRLQFVGSSAALLSATHNVWSSGVHQLHVDADGDGQVNSGEVSRLFLVASGTASTSHTGLESQNFSVHDRLSNHVFVYYYGDPDGSGVGINTAIDRGDNRESAWENQLDRDRRGGGEGDWDYYNRSGVGFNVQATPQNTAMAFVTQIPAQVWEFHLGFDSRLGLTGQAAEAFARDHVLHGSNTSRLASQAEGMALYAANFGRDTPGSEWLYNAAVEAHRVGALQPSRHWGATPAGNADNVPRGYGNGFMTAMPGPSGDYGYVDLINGSLFDGPQGLYSVVL